VRHALVILLSFGCLVARGEEKAGAATSTTAESSIATAKQDFEALKSAREAGTPGKAELPRVTMPELQLGAAEPPQPWTAPNSSNPTARKSESWLLDAMEKKPGAPSRTSARGEKSATDLLPSEKKAGDVEDARMRDRISTSSRGGADDTANPAETPPSPKAVDNPLTRYMGQWMTPQDYALLQPTLSVAARAGTSPGDFGTALPGSAVDGAAAANLDLAFGPPVNVPPPAPRAPAENPYLAGLSLPANQPPSASTGPAAAAPAPTMPPPTLIAPAPEPAPVKSTVPDFVKPSDEKYFKPLKRF
jgi:hypothetical protein